jgi:hypothetical protein
MKRLWEILVWKVLGMIHFQGLRINLKFHEKDSEKTQLGAIS